MLTGVCVYGIITTNTAEHFTLPPLSQCPTNNPHGSFALKPTEVTLPALVEVSNEMRLCSYSQRLDRPARRPAGPSGHSPQTRCAYRLGNEGDKVGRRRAALSSWLFIQYIRVLQMEGGGEGLQRQRARDGADVDTDTDTDKMALSSWLGPNVLLSNLNSKEKKESCFLAALL